MDYLEPEHIRMLRDSLRRFVEAEMPRSEVAKWDEHGDFPVNVFAKLAGLGVMGLTIPEEYGGAGRDIVATMVVIEELARRSLAVAIPYLNMDEIEEILTPPRPVFQPQVIEQLARLPQPVIVAVHD